MTTKPKALTDLTNAYLKRFESHSFKAEELKDNVPVRAQLDVTENFTRFTQDETTSDAGLVMDPDDKDRVDFDLKARKDFVSTLKFAYLESNQKLAFVNRILHKDGPAYVSTEENALKEQERRESKAVLKEKKNRAAEMEQLMREEAERFDEPYQIATRDAALAKQLLQDCAAMEVEIAMLKNKRTDEERITILEAQLICEQQETKMASNGPNKKACEVKTRETKTKIKAHKLAIDRLAHATKEMRKEQDERESQGTRDENSEADCRWITNADKLYSSLLGIKSAQAIGSPATEMQIVYESPQGTEGDIRTLSISLGKDGKMIGARLLNSSDQIQDIVDLYLDNQDVRSLVQEVRARIGR